MANPCIAWSRRGRRAGVALLLAAALSFGGSEADAGWLSRRMLGPQGAAAADATGSGSSAAFEAASSHLRALSGAAKARALAVAATHEGHWRLANAAGEHFTAASPEELTRAFENLIGKDVAPPALYLAEHTVFAARDRLRELPKGATFHVVVADRAYRVHRIQGSAPGRDRLFAMVGPRLVVELIERAVFDEVLWQLEQPLAGSRIRQVALEPGGPAALGTAPRIDPATRKAEVDRLSPGALSGELGSVRGQTVLLSGRLEADRLVFQPASRSAATGFGSRSRSRGSTARSCRRPWPTSSPRSRRVAIRWPSQARWQEIMSACPPGH